MVRFLKAKGHSKFSAALVTLLTIASAVQGDEITFDIDPDRSVMVSTALIKALNEFTTPQGDGSDTTTYSGTITVDLDVLESPTELQFLSASAVAADSGDWLPEPGGGVEGNPGNPGPANYGIVLDAGIAGVLLGAFRETVFTIDSTELVVEDGIFDSGQTFTTTQGFLDSNIISPLFGDTAGQDDVTGDNTANVSETPGSYVFGADGVATLTIPVDLDFLSGDEDGVDFFFDGILVATFGTPTLLPGDANLDGRVDAADLNILGLNWLGMDKTRSEGDFTGDGIVNSADLNVLGINWQTGVGNPAAVPEPSGLILLVTAVFPLLSSCRRRRMHL